MRQNGFLRKPSYIRLIYASASEIIYSLGNVWFQFSRSCEKRQNQLAGFGNQLSSLAVGLFGGSRSASANSHKGPTPRYIDCLCALSFLK